MGSNIRKMCANLVQTIIKATGVEAVKKLIDTFEVEGASLEEIKECLNSSDGKTTPLFAAIDNSSEGNVEIVDQLITLGADVNLKIDSNGYSALEKACKNQDLQMVKKLLSRGAIINWNENFARDVLRSLTIGYNPNATTIFNTTIIDIFKELISKIEDINKIIYDGKTLLHIVCEWNLVPWVELLIKRGSNVNIANKYNGKTVLHLVASGDHTGYNVDQLIITLLKNGANIHSITTSGLPAFLAICAYGGAEVISLLYSIGGREIINRDIVVGGWTPLHMACYHWGPLSHQEGIMKLIELGANPNKATYKGWKPLHVACKGENHFAVQKLKELDSVNIDDATESGWTPLMIACTQSIKGTSSQIIKTLLSGDKKPNVNIALSNGWTALHLASWYGADYNVIESLVKAGGDISLITTDGYTLHGWPILHLACRYGDLKLLEHQVENGIDINATISDGWTTLHIAYVYKKLNIVEKLISLGADVNKTMPNNISILHLACKDGDLETAKQLIKVGADINCTMPNGLTPLHLAYMSGNVEIVKHLIDAGAKCDGYISLDLLSKNLLKDKNVLEDVKDGKNVKKKLTEPIIKRKHIVISLCILVNNITLMGVMLTCGILSIGSVAIGAGITAGSILGVGVGLIVKRVLSEWFNNKKPVPQEAMKVKLADIKKMCEFDLLPPQSLKPNNLKISTVGFEPWQEAVALEKLKEPDKAQRTLKGTDKPSTHCRTKSQVFPYSGKMKLHSRSKSQTISVTSVRSELRRLDAQSIRPGCRSEFAR